MSRSGAASQAAYRYELALFVDWCAAAEVSALPASSVTLAEFLGENPGSDAAQRRRVAAIDRRHRDAGCVAPGSVTSMRVALDRARADRVARRAAQDWLLASALPWSGSHAALFGRRDAVLLLLAGAGLSYTAIAGLDRSEVAADGGDLWVGGAHRVRVAAEGFPDGSSPADIWARWTQVLAFSDRYPSTMVLLKRLRDNSFPDMSGLEVRPGPVAVPIDRWGHLPFLPVSMTAAAIAGVVAAHRTGTVPSHIAAPAGRTRGADNRERQDDLILTDAVVEQDSVVLDPGYYRRGVADRRRSHAVLADVGGLADEVDERIEALLQRTLDLLGGAVESPDPP
ncbi:hypothetical protein [Rhodococcoides trifolii]|uniref:hypothetical protein n=1 Tax=Rhodococcoides trifolii TaxID=908250 RepID=UPI00166DFDA9|nr:hypothetical protein [Rhodococcus trifolii]